MMNRCEKFQEYLENSENIFDIMAAACKMAEPYEPRNKMVSDVYLKKAVFRFSESDNGLDALEHLKRELGTWIEKIKNSDSSQIKAKFYHLIDLIDQKCVSCKDMELPDSYYEYTSLNRLLSDEIIILPRFDSSAIKQLSDIIAKRDINEAGFRPRNQFRTAYVSGNLKYFVILKQQEIWPVLHVASYSKEIEQEFEKKGSKLKVGIFPLSSLNLKKMFQVKERRMIANQGLFSIEMPKGQHEEIMINCCKQALEICKNEQVDIAIFPEMLFTKKIHEAVCGYAKEYYSTKREGQKDLPWFIWLGTAWSDNENTCCVIDRYGKVIFRQKKMIPYIYKDKKTGVIFNEDLSRSEDEWQVHFLDIPQLFRIGTAICRDISSEPLKTLLKTLYADILIMPAFSKSNALTKRNIDPLAREKIIVIVCNTCSSQCGQEERFIVNEENIGMELPFCYLCLPGKERTNGKDNDNAPVFHRIRFNTSCQNCAQNCPGHIFSIYFKECSVAEENCFSAKVSYGNECQ